MSRWEKMGNLFDKVESGNISIDDAISEFSVLIRDFVDKEDIAQYDGCDSAMINVGGKPYRCECGANVFSNSKKNPNLYRCNGCGLELFGE